MIFEFAGAYLAGGEVTATIRSGIIDSNAFADTPDLLVLGMIASLLAAGLWLILASIPAGPSPPPTPSSAPSWASPW